MQNDPQSSLKKMIQSPHLKKNRRKKCNQNENDEKNESQSTLKQKTNKTLYKRMTIHTGKLKEKKQKRHLFHLFQQRKKMN